MEEARLAGNAVAAFVIAGSIAGVAGVGIPPVAIVRGDRIADEIVTRQDPALEIGMLCDSGIDDGYRYARAADLEIPGGRRVDACRVLQRPLLAVKRIVWNASRKRAPHRVGILHGGVDLQLLGHAVEQIFGYRLAQSHYPYVADLALDAERHADQVRPSRQQNAPVGRGVAD